MLPFFLMLIAVFLWSSPSHSQMAVPIPRGSDIPGPLLVQEPFCEFGYGTCGGACSEEGKKPWDCPAKTVPCFQKGQHCSGEEADMCKPRRKRTGLIHPYPAIHGATQASFLSPDETGRPQPGAR
jgi:hypothetical protein